MQTKLDGPYLVILAALGLDLACVGRVSGEGDDEVASASESDGDSDSATGGSESNSDTGSGTSTADTSTADTDPDESSTSDTGSDPYVCEDPQPIMQAGTDIPSGFVLCADGFIHRAEPVECVEPQGADDPECSMGVVCTSAADCIEKPYGSCAVVDPLAGCGCQYGCATDADCDAGFVCACAGVVGDLATCIPAGCVSDPECGDGLCGLSEYEGCCGSSWELECAAPDEPCHVDADCTEAPCNPEYPRGEWAMFQCTTQSDFGGVEGWTCQPPGWCGCDCGRPFFVEGRVRMAAAIERADWIEPVGPRAVDRQTRRRLAGYWTEIGQLEHASIASFARFCLQLIQIGAPAELIADSQRAMADEIRHARAAFGLASAYAGAPVGPGALDVEGSLASGGDVRAIVEGLVVEACVGETLAAIEVREAARHAEDPVVAALLDAIAADELRHAGLGWRSLRWILDHADASLRAFAWATFDAAMHVVRSTRAISLGTPRGAAGLPENLRRHGVLDDALREQVRLAGIASLIGPCVVALRGHYDDATASVSTS